MDLAEFGRLLSDVLSMKLMDIGGTPLTVGTVVTAIVIIIGAYVVSTLIQRALTRAFSKRGVNGEYGAGVVGRLLHHLLMLTGLAVALQTAGIELGALFTAGAVFAVGLGFAM